MGAFPTGTVTLLFADVEGSTRLLRERGADAYASLLTEHRRTVRETFGACGGVEVDTQGDAFFFVFPQAGGALEAARRLERRLAAGPVRFRIGIHTGEPLLTPEGYFGIDVHRGARLMSAGHGGQVLLSETTAALVDEDAELVDLGLHRLKDLTRPQRLFQLGDSEFPPLRTLHQTNLPVQPTPLVGREAELTELLALLSGTARLVTLTGTGGSGKTRLALQAAAELVGTFPDGVWWVPLAALREPSLVETTVAQALGVQDDLDRELRDRKLLLLLDNFEHVHEASPAVSSLLEQAPDVRVLVTSRERLALAAEHEYPVPMLRDPEAVALFTARARQVAPGFEPDDQVSEICRQLDGLPLAVELAAARVKVLTTAQILERLTRSLDLLSTRSPDAAERHRTLRATIGWSHALLSAADSGLFARLAVFRGGWALSAAEGVCDGSLESLESLVEKNLVRSREGRFFMLRTIQEYAADRLHAAGSAAELRRRHALYFLAEAEDEAPAFTYGRREAAAMAAFARDNDNFRAAISWALHEGETEIGARLCVALARFWFVDGSLRREGLGWLEQVLAGGGSNDPEIRARALAHAGALAVKIGDVPKGERFAGAALDLARSHGDAHVTLSALLALSNAAVGGGDTTRSRELLEEGLRIAREVGHPREVARFLGNLGLRALDEGRVADARKLWIEVLEIARALESEELLGRAEANLGIVALLENRLEEADKLLTRSLKGFVRLGFREGVSFCLNGLSAVAVRSNEPFEAGRLLGASLAAREDAGLNVATPAFERLAVATEEVARRALGKDGYEAALLAGRQAFAEEPESLHIAKG